MPSSNNAQHSVVTQPRRLMLAAFGMFAFGYVLVPLYDVLCRATGLNGKTAPRAVVPQDNVKIDEARSVTVEMVGTVNTALPWDFIPVTPALKIHPGTVKTVEYVVRNNSAQELIGRAVPSVAPGVAANFFKKLECFCFTPQTLAAYEEKRLIVRFYVSPELPNNIGTLTLSYTLFPERNAAVAKIN